jgi:hypothetical protein
MSKKSFIKRILTLRRGEESTEKSPAPEVGGDIQASQSGEAALKPSITEILFRRRTSIDEEGIPQTESHEAGTAVSETALERRVSKKEETAQKISEGFDNLSGLLKSIGSKLEDGNERGRSLADSIEGLPEVLRSIPETNRAQIEFLGTISKQLDLQTTRSGEFIEHLRTLPEILANIPESQRQQAEQLKEITSLLTETSQSQIDYAKSVQKAQQATVAAFQSAQNKSLNLFHKAQQQSISTFQGTQTAQAQQMQAFIERTQRSMNRVFLACATVVGIAAIAAAAIFYLK